MTQYQGIARNSWGVIGIGLLGSMYACFMRARPEAQAAAVASTLRRAPGYHAT